MKRQRIQLAIGFGISAIFIYYLLPGLKLDEVADTLRTANYWWIIPGVAVYFVGLGARTWLHPVQPIVDDGGSLITARRRDQRPNSTGRTNQIGYKTCWYRDADIGILDGVGKRLPEHPILPKRKIYEEGAPGDVLCRAFVQERGSKEIGLFVQ